MWRCGNCEMYVRPAQAGPALGCAGRCHPGGA
nr:MAG TPA: hypothetical protein [Caudoviricetes sp.]